MRLNLGAGPVRLSGFTAVDLDTGDERVNLAVTPWPWATRSVEGVLASHILEHFPREGAVSFLAECARILKPGGVLALAVPDLDKFVDCWTAGDFAPLGGYAHINLNWLMGGGPGEPNPAQRHRSVWSWWSLRAALEDVGLKAVRVEFGGSALGAVHTREYRAISLYVDAFK